MSSYGIGQMNQLGDALERVGVTREDLTTIGQSPKLCGQVRDLARGNLEVREQRFPIWARIKLGGYKSSDVLIAELERQKVRVIRWARDIAGKLAMSPDERELELVAPTMRELGFSKPARFDEVCARAHEHGLELVPQDVALYVALRAGDQVSRGELFIFAMESVTDSSGDRSVFGLDRDPLGQLELIGLFGSPVNRLYPGHRVVVSRT